MMSKALFSTGNNEWETPQDIFDDLDDEFEFTLDVAASDYNHKCERYYTIEDDALSIEWDRKERVWCNPPYSSRLQDKFVEKCWKHWRNGGLAVMLIPARTDTKRFQDYILGNAEVRFINGRLRFGNSNECAPFPSMIVVFYPRRYGIYCIRSTRKKHTT